MTLLFDEVDTIWGSRGKDDNHEDLRGLLNAGYKRGATIPRCVPPRFEVQRFAVFCPVALAGIGNLPDTILTRSIIIRMRRRGPNEYVEPFRPRKNEPEGHGLRNRLGVFADSVGEAVGNAWPKMPEGIVDRPQEIWEPLIAIADAAGGHWPETARNTCVAMCKAATDRQISLGIRLLADPRTIFANSDAMYSSTIIDRLCDPEAFGLEADAPWGDLRGKPICQRKLASLLKGYDIRPAKIREPGGPSRNGYRREDLHDAWERWLPPLTGKAEQAEQTEQLDSASTRGVPHVLDDPHIPWRACAKCDGEGCHFCRGYKRGNGAEANQGIF